MKARIAARALGIAARQPSRRLRATREIANPFVNEGVSSRFDNGAPAQTFPSAPRSAACAAILALIFSTSLAHAAPKKPAPLPILGTMLRELPAGKMKVVADRACLNCHSSDMLRQQRLTEKQWTAELTKMTNWGSDLKDSEKEDLLAYLVKNFGPDNDRFEPVATKPVAPPPSSRRR